MFQQYRSRLFSLSAEFRNANSADHAIRLAGDLCSVLADLVGDISTAGDRLATIERTIAQLNEPQSQPEPQPVYVSIVDPSFGITAQPGDQVYFETDLSGWQAGIFVIAIPNSENCVIRLGDIETVYSAKDLYSREYPIAYPKD
jgi:hypothetical protein